MNNYFVNHFHCVRGQGTSSIVTNPTLMYISLYIYVFQH